VKSDTETSISQALEPLFPFSFSGTGGTSSVFGADQLFQRSGSRHPKCPDELITLDIPRAMGEIDKIHQNFMIPIDKNVAKSTSRRYSYCFEAEERAAMPTIRQRKRMYQ